MRTHLLAACLCLSVATSAIDNKPLSEWRMSRSTFDGYWDAGNCGFGTIATDSFPYGYIAAPNTALYNDSNTCGHCIEVKCVDDWDGSTPDCCKSGSVVTQVSDQCLDAEWCNGDVDHLVLSDLAFAEISEPICGVIETRIRRVDCNFGSSAPMLWVSGPGINQWYYRVTLENANGYGHLSLVEIREDGYDTWIAGVRQTYNAWVFESPPNGNWHAPLDARVTGFGGEQITALELVTSFVERVEYEMDNFALHSGGDTTNVPQTTDEPQTTEELLTTEATDVPETSEAPLTTEETELPETSEQTHAPQSTSKMPTTTKSQPTTSTSSSTTEKATTKMPSTSSSEKATIMATNTTESGIEESDDSSTGRRLVFSARMWLFYCGVICLSAVGCTFIWTKYKRNQRTTAEVLRLEMAISSELERKKSHAEIVKKATAERFSRALAAAASVPSSEIQPMAPFNDEVVASSTEMAMLSSNLDMPSSLPRSVEEVSSSNDLELGRQTAMAGESEAVAEGFAETGVKGAAIDMLVKAGEISVEMKTTPTLSEHFFDEVEGAVAGDVRGTAVDAWALAQTEDDEDCRHWEALSAAVPITKGSKDCATIATKRIHVSQKSDGSLNGISCIDAQPGSGDGHVSVGAYSSGFAALRRTIEDGAVDDAKVVGSTTPGGSHWWV